MEFEINLERLHFYSYHGVYEEERSIGNEFFVSISIRIPCDKKIEEDDLEGTISYAELYEIVNQEMKNTRKLLEKVASSIAHRIREIYKGRILTGKIRIEKVRPPIPGMLGSASVTLLF